jgi:hypothetical protein
LRSPPGPCPTPAPAPSSPQSCCVQKRLFAYSASTKEVTQVEMLINLANTKELVTCFASTKSCIQQLYRTDWACNEHANSCMV